MVSTTAYVYDLVDRLTKTSNPYGPNDSAQYLVSSYDPLGRTTSVTPPSLPGTNQNAYQSQYSPATYTDAAGATHSGTSLQTTDPAGKPRKQYFDGLGRVVRVDEPSTTSPGTSATASVTITGALNNSSSGGGAAPLAASNSQLTSFLASDGSSHTFYLSTNQHIWHLFWNSTGGWQNQDLTAITSNTPTATNSPLSAVFDRSGNTEVFYLDSSQHVHELFCCYWRDYDLTAITGNTLAASGSAFTAEVPSTGNPVLLYYLDTNQHVNVLFINSNAPGWPWQNGDLTAGTKGPVAAAGSSLTNVLDSGGTTHVFYLDGNQHINQLWCCSGSVGWNNQDVAALSGGGVAMAGSKLAIFGNSPSFITLVYQGSNGHIWQEYWNGSTWNNGDLSAFSGTSVVPASGTALTSFLDSPNERSFYFGTDSHLDELLWNGSNMSNLDLTMLTGNGAPIARSALTSFGMSGGNPIHVLYVGTNQHVYHMFLNSSGSWTNQDVTSMASVTLADSGTVSLDVGGFTATACYGNSTNSACSGTAANITSAQVASALVQSINVTGSPATASVSGSAINLTWKEPGPNSSPVAALSSTSDHPNTFPNGSFSSQATIFSGGAGPSLSNPASTFYSYSFNTNIGQLQTTVTEGQQTRTYSYDSLGRLTSSCIPEASGNCTTYSYTDFGAASTKTDPRLVPGSTTHISTTYGFDTWNHVNDVTYNDGTPEVKFTYGGPGAANNSAGRLSSSTDGTASKSYQYDVMGHVTQVTQTLNRNNYVTKYGYQNGQLHTITYPSGSASSSGTTVTFTPDDIGRLKTLAANGTNVYSVNSYNAAEQPLSTTFGNQMSGGYTYNNQLQLSTIQYGSTTASLLNLNYNYGAALDNGEIQSINDNLVPSRSTAYVYDALGRLQQAQTIDQTSANTWNLAFGYDRYGNRLSQTPSGGAGTMPSVTVTVDPATNHITGAGYSYDAAGNMTNDSFNTYAFDAANRITSVSQPGTSTPVATYAYDDGGLRAKKNTNLYIYSGGQVIAEYTNGATAGSPNAEYIYAGGRRIATLAGGSFTYHYWDHLSIRSSADGSGNVARTYGSFPFGETWYETGTANKWKFTTYENDSESGLNYALARFQSPRLGRFMSLDPADGHNLYIYAEDDPVNLADPAGLAPQTTCLLINGIHTPPEKNANALRTNDYTIFGTYPYPTGGRLKGILQVLAQGILPIFFHSPANTAAAGINQLKSYPPGSATVFFYSGGAQAGFTAADLGKIDPAAIAAISDCYLISPGFGPIASNPCKVLRKPTKTVSGSGLWDGLTTFNNNLFHGGSDINTNCDHTDLKCLLLGLQTLDSHVFDNCTGVPLIPRDDFGPTQIDLYPIQEVPIQEVPIEFQLFDAGIDPTTGVEIDTDCPTCSVTTVQGDGVVVDANHTKE